ncbi:MAG: cupredoxin domain-containing protein [Acidimicrobiales bacterium]
MPQSKRAAVAAVAALSLLVGACSSGSGGGDASQPTTGPIDLTVKSLDPGGKYSFDAKSYTAKAGTVNVALVNEGKENHNLLIEGVDKAKFKISVTPGATTSGAVTLAARTYTVYCDIAGHRAAGMEAKLVVS